MPLSLSSYRSLHNGSINAEPSCWGQGMCAVLSRSVVSDSLWPHGLQPTRLLCPWISQARILEWVAMPASRGSSQPRVITNPGLPYRRRILYCLSHQGTPKILEWVAYPFSRDLPNPGIKPGSPALQADSLSAELPATPCMYMCVCIHMYIHTPYFLYPFTCQWSLGCFYVFFVVDSAGINIGVHVSFQIRIFSRCVHKSRIAGSYGNYF